ncbi:hypothetical protein NQZ68_037200 [Dissostichus eleginoides]|nr:hypothetical protein NQZ68_037200 [Dissostichus eleginoides]
MGQQGPLSVYAVSQQISRQPQQGADAQEIRDFRKLQFKEWMGSKIDPALRPCPQKPAHLGSDDDSRGPEMSSISRLVCVSFSADVWPFVYERDRWWFGKMLRDRY